METGESKFREAIADSLSRGAFREILRSLITVKRLRDYDQRDQVINAVARAMAKALHTPDVEARVWARSRVESVYLASIVEYFLELRSTPFWYKEDDVAKTATWPGEYESWDGTTLELHNGSAVVIKVES